MEATIEHAAEGQRRREGAVCGGGISRRAGTNANRRGGAFFQRVESTAWWAGVGAGAARTVCLCVLGLCGLRLRGLFDLCRRRTAPPPPAAQAASLRKPVEVQLGAPPLAGRPFTDLSTSQSTHLARPLHKKSPSCSQGRGGKPRKANSPASLALCWGCPIRPRSADSWPKPGPDKAPCHPFSALPAHNKRCAGQQCRGCFATYRPASRAVHVYTQ